MDTYKANMLVTRAAPTRSPGHQRPVRQKHGCRHGSMQRGFAGARSA